MVSKLISFHYLERLYNVAILKKNDCKKILIISKYIKPKVPSLQFGENCTSPYSLFGEDSLQGFR